MSESERARIEHFRQRWALDYFRNSQNSSPSQRQMSRNSSRRTPNNETEIPEVNAPKPASETSSRFKRFREKSWRDNLRRSPEGRLADVGGPEPVSDDEEPTESSSEMMNGEAGTDRASREPSQPQSKPQTSTPDQPSERPAWLIELCTWGYLIFFALMGTLARLGVEAITQYPDAPVTSRVLWANLGGSFVMGFPAEDRSLFGLPDHLKASLSKGEKGEADEGTIYSTHLKHKKALSLYVGLTTGFCGSFTSFSSFIRDSFLALTNDLPTSSPTTPYRAADTVYHRNGGFSFLALLAILILHPAISLAAMKTGAHFAILLRGFIPRPVFQPNVLRILDPSMVVIGFGCWIGSLFLTIFPPTSGPSPVNWRARATIPLIFGPLGCLLRYYLAKWLNRPSTPNFPVGTFAANVLGTLVLGMAWDLAHARTIGASPNGGNACAVLTGVEEGFCGCLSTVSTWVLELNGLKRRYAWIYGLTSVGVSLAGMIVVMGSMGWTIGFASPVCG